jgi:hypothetical protein
MDGGIDREIDIRDGLEGWIRLVRAIERGIDEKDGLEGLSVWLVGWTDKRMEGWIRGGVQGWIRRID